MPQTKISRLSAVQKSCRVLAALSDPQVSRLTDIAQRSGVDMATALRILKELGQEGFVERDPDTKQYALGPQVYALHHAMVGGLDVRALARPSLIRLAREFGDTAVLSIPMGWESVCIDLCFGDYPIRANYLDLGSRRPLGVGAGSLALLAGLAPAEAQAILPAVHKALAQRYPRLSAAELLEATQRARELGHAMLLDVVVEKMGGLGVAIRGPGGRPIAALSITALSERIVPRETELACALLAEAHAIERVWMPSN